MEAKHTQNTTMIKQRSYTKYIEDRYIKQSEQISARLKYYFQIIFTDFPGIYLFKL